MAMQAKQVGGEGQAGLAVCEALADLLFKVCHLRQHLTLNGIEPPAEVALSIGKSQVPIMRVICNEVADHSCFIEHPIVSARIHRCLSRS